MRRPLTVLIILGLVAAALGSIAALPANLNDRVYNHFVEIATGFSGAVGLLTQAGATANTVNTGGANAVVTATLAATNNQRGHVYAVDAFCSSGGTGNLQITDTGVVIWASVATEVGQNAFRKTWNTPLTGSTNAAMGIQLSGCGVGKSGTLIVQADIY